MNPTESFVISTHGLSKCYQGVNALQPLNHGQLVAQAPIAELLNGNGGIEYSITLRGATDAARTLLVHVTDERAAEGQLLRLVLDDHGTTVLAFGRQKQNLEAIFLQIVEGGSTYGNYA